MRRLLIVGAVGHGRFVSEAVMATGNYVVIGFADDAAPDLTQLGIYGLGGKEKIVRHGVGLRKLNHTLIALLQLLGLGERFSRLV
ncbi:MAG: hypothetical protein KJ614_07200 [Gammaproteobacteria bacterium]|nr:hypothetical protein [Gammaproteobacteria bacterium]MBU3996125.1 hypothetical protein [Gammaproteobacteria bacterium]MBU4080826.1 hypothetical protein [Gammaproteobacteria bacterium]MBU4112471.1 hypothetical protein [Gammaproteobacteria bacterium]MBU4169814.1 hypothetical protein [Gammaproteobacteria bacterium]